jgi:hypothetical protein
MKPPRLNNNAVPATAVATTTAKRLRFDVPLPL